MREPLMNDAERRRLLVKSFVAQMDAIDREIAPLLAKKAAIMRTAKKAGVPRMELKGLRAERRKRRTETRYGPRNQPPEDFMG